MARQALPATQPRRKVGRLLANVAVASLVAVSLVSPAHAADDPLPYIDTEGVLQEHTSGYTLMQDADLDALNGWYLCEGPTDLGPLRVEGVAHLVLADDCDLTAQGTLDRTPGIRLASGNQLSIYAQSTGDQQGRVTATGTVKELGASAGAGIGTSEGSERFGNLTIAGGYIAATGAGGAAAGIGTSFRGTGGSVTVTGGTVDAQSGMYAAGIGGGQQGAMETINITGGTVTARGGSVGIGASSTHYGTGSVTIAGDASVTTINGGPRPALGTENHSPGGNDPVTVSVATTGVVTTERTWGTGPTIGYGQTATAWLVTTEVTGDGTLLPRGLADLPEGATQGTFSIPVGDGESMTFDAQPGPELETLWLTLDGERLTELDYHTLGDVQRDHTLSAGFGVMQTVSAASIDLDAPEFGEPLATTATTSDLDYTVQSLEWDPAHTTGASATPYTATVVLTPEPGHIFDGSTAATVNGNAATAALEDNGALTVTHTFPTTDQAIANAALTIEAPVFGESLATTATTSDTDYTVESLEWDPAHSTGASATAYTATVTLAPKDGHAFGSILTVTVNDESAGVTLNSDGTLTATYMFGVTATWIDQATLTLDQPVVSKGLETEVTTTQTTYTASEVTWSPADTAAQSVTAYTATVVLTPESGQVFDAASTATLNGAAADATLEADGTLTVTYEFPATDQAIDAAELFINPPVLYEPLSNTVASNHSSYGVSGLNWSPADMTGAPNMAYTATVSLFPGNGYAFVDATTATVNGHAAIATLGTDGTLTVTYEFPATDRESVEIALSGIDANYTYGDGAFTVSATANASGGGDDEPPGDIAPMNFSPMSLGAKSLIPVTFSSSDPTVATVTNHGDGTATVTILRAGTFTLSASTAQTPTLHPSQIDTEITVLEATPTLTLTSGAGSISAAVAGAGDTPQGTVTFYVDGDVWETNVPLTDGTAAVDLDGLAPGDRTITAVFHGDAGFYAVAEGDAITVTITPDEVIEVIEVITDDDDQTSPGGDSDQTLPVTGGIVHFGLIAAALALLLVGGVLALHRRQSEAV